MNTIDHMLTRIPLYTLTIHTRLDAYSVIERIERADRAKVRWRGEDRYYTFEVDYEGNFFTIQARYRENDGDDVFEPWGRIRLLSISIPVPIEQSPILYGRVCSPDHDSVTKIKCHFGMPIPGYLLCITILAFLLSFVIVVWFEVLKTISALAFLWMIYSLYQFFVERAGLIELMKRLFHDVIIDETRK